jgi:hypothetical protein
VRPEILDTPHPLFLAKSAESLDSKKVQKNDPAKECVAD